VTAKVYSGFQARETCSPWCGASSAPRFWTYTVNTAPSWVATLYWWLTPMFVVIVTVGGSGVGKSVMLKMLIGLLKPDGGSVRFDGQEVTGMSERQLSQLRQRIAMLFQAGALFDSMTVGENVAYGLEEHFRETMSVNDRRDRVQWALELVGLPGIQDMDPADLSGGMRKRVALARSIAVQPEVVLYDEPTTGLDPVATKNVDEMIRRTADDFGVTSVVISHDMASTFRIGDRISMLHGGKIVVTGTAEEVLASPHPALREFVETSGLVAPAGGGQA